MTAFAADAAAAASTVSSKAVNTGTIGDNARIAQFDSFSVAVTLDQTAYFVVMDRYAPSAASGTA
jgi:hypothetical protein